jgi:tripartite-type tricarboxylate transporter receptor subunit TctC
MTRERRKSKAETQPTVSKTRPTRRRPIEPVLLHGHLLRVKATEFPRRRFLHLAAGAAAVPATSRIAMAQTYPTRPVKIIVAAAAGGGTNVAARLIGQSLSERLGRSFLVENRPGGNNNIGTEAVVRAPADGYTLLMANSLNAINASLYERLSYDFIRDMAPVAHIADMPLFLVVDPRVPARSVPEFIAYARANPGKLILGSGGIGAPGTVAGELFKMTTGLDLPVVRYRGGAPVIADLLGGHVQATFDIGTTSIEQVRAGRLRALAILSATRSELLPDIPIMADYVPGVEASFWAGIVAPKNTPAAIVDKLNKEINATLADPRTKARFADLNLTVFPGCPAEFGQFIAEDTEKWRKVVKFAGLKAD